MNGLRIVRLQLKLGVLNELQYRTNFFIQLIQSAVALGAGLVGLQVVFAYTDSLAGWNQNELLAILGAYFLLAGCIQALIRPNMDRLIEQIHRGTLDLMLTKPEDSQLLVSTQVIAFWQSLDMVTGLIVLIVSAVRLHVELTPGLLGLCLLGLVLGAILLYSLWLMVSTTAFWFIRVTNLLGILDSLYQTGRWPIATYPVWLRIALTVLAPVAIAVSVPAQALTGRLEFSTLISAAFITVVFFLLARRFWHIGLRSYSGASA